MDIMEEPSVTQLIQNILKYDGTGSVGWRRNVRTYAGWVDVPCDSAKFERAAEYRWPHGRGRAGARTLTLSETLTRARDA